MDIERAETGTEKEMNNLGMRDMQTETDRQTDRNRNGEQRKKTGEEQETGTVRDKARQGDRQRQRKKQTWGDSWEVTGNVRATQTVAWDWGTAAGGVRTEVGPGKAEPVPRIYHAGAGSGRSV